MIRARFYKDPQDRLVGFCVSGHAGFADFGNDIACASVSSAVMLTVNTASEVFKLDARTDVQAGEAGNTGENEILFMLGNDSSGSGDKLLLGLLLQLDILSDEFPGCISVSTELSAPDGGR